MKNYLKLRWVQYYCISTLVVLDFLKFFFVIFFSVDFLIGKAKSPPYIYFRFIWLTDLESVPRVELPTLIISTKFEVDTTIHRQVTALLVRIHYVTLWPWLLTFWPWTVVKHGRSRDQPLHKVWRFYAYPFLTYELWCPPYATVNNAFGATAHAPYHVTCA